MLKRKQELEKEEFRLSQQRDQLELDYHLDKSLAAEELKSLTRKKIMRSLLRSQENTTMWEHVSST